MKRSSILFVLILTLASLTTSTAAFADYCINKDFTNTGSVPAYDIIILITGNQPINTIFYGFAAGPIPGTSLVSAGIFKNFSALLQGGNELLHWQNLNGANDVINPGAFVHVGWCTSSANNMVNVQWSDINGAPLPGSVIQETGVEPWPNHGLQWQNIFATDTAPAVIGNIRYALLAAPFTLDQLNPANDQLVGELKPLPGPATVTLAPGASFTAPVPGGTTGQWVAVVYDVNGKGSGAATTDWVQFQLQ